MFQIFEKQKRKSKSKSKNCQLQVFEKSESKKTNHWFQLFSKTAKNHQVSWNNQWVSRRLFDFLKNGEPRLYISEQGIWFFW